MAEDTASKSEKIIVNTKSGKYPVIIGKTLNFGELTRDVKDACKVVIVSDDVVFPLYGDAVMKGFSKSGYRVNACIIRNGETSKTLSTIEKILEFVAKEELTRTDILVALGGGVVGDITGFAAAIYLRGIDFIQIPTTVLAAVDSSVGGKTGVDLNSGKNIVGAFHQPKAVFCDPNFFGSLTEAVYADGMAEVIKHAMIKDRDMMFALDDLSAAEMCKRNIKIKASVVELDEFDTGIRKILNFGHTVGHAVEVLSDYKISHGSAVSIGMTVISRASENLGLTEEPVLTELTEILKKHKLPVQCDYSSKNLADAALRDKKRSGEKITLVIPKKIGSAELYDLPVEKLESFISKGLEK